MEDNEKLELIGLRAFYNYFFDNLYSEGYEVIDPRDWGNPEGMLSDFIDAAYDAKVQAETLAGSDPEPSTKELLVSKELPHWVKWLARDKDGKIYAYEDQPVKDTHDWLSPSGEFERVKETNDSYAIVKWTDPQPTKIVRRQPQ